MNIPYCCDIKVTLVTLPYGNVVSTLKHLLCHNNMINFCMPSLISHNCSVPCCSYIKATLAILRHAKAVTTIKHFVIITWISVHQALSVKIVVNMPYCSDLKGTLTTLQ